MAPGRRTTRSTAHNPQIDQTINVMTPGRRTTRSTIQNQLPERATHSILQSQPIGRTTRSNVQSQLPRSTTHSAVHSQPPRCSTHSTGESQQLGRTQDDRPITESTAHIQPPECTAHSTGHSQDDSVASQTQSGQSVSVNKSRGLTRGVKTASIAKASANGKLPVTFDEECRQPICTNAERFNNDIGFIVRNHGSFHYKEWRVVPEEIRAPLRHYLLETYDIDLLDETTIKCIDEQMRKAWRSHKYKLHTYFKEIGGEEDVEMAKRKRHPDLKDDHQEDWEILCDRWCTPEFKERALKNTNNRSKRKWESRNGSVSTPRHHIRRGMDLASSTGQIETWRLKHYDMEKGWTGPDLETLYNEMKALRDQHTPEELSDKNIMECILGRRSVHLRGWGQSFNGASGTSQRNTTQPDHPTYEELLQKLNEAYNRLDSTNERLSLVVDILHHNNLMPPPNVPPSDQASGARNRDSSEIQEQQYDS
ncbi:hypothetical protein CsatB_016498 [Cannabis sativa]